MSTPSPETVHGPQGVRCSVAVSGSGRSLRISFWTRTPTRNVCAGHRNCAQVSRKITCDVHVDKAVGASKRRELTIWNEAKAGMKHERL
jgi:hypothetical protein